MTISSSSLELSIIAVAQTLDSNAVILLFTARLVDFTGPQLRHEKHYCSTSQKYGSEAKLFVTSAVAISGYDEPWSRD
jgi:hypothetical protein